MNKKIGADIDQEHYISFHNSITEFLEAFRPVLDDCDKIYEDVVAKALLDDSEEINKQLETVTKINNVTFNQVLNAAAINVKTIG